MRVDIEFNSAGHVPSPGILEAASIAEEKGFGTVSRGRFILGIDCANHALALTDMYKPDRLSISYG